MKVTFIPIVALGTVTKGLVQGLEDLEITTILLSSTRIPRRFLENYGDLLSFKLL